MLFQPLITFVVLAINIGNISAGRNDKDKPHVPQLIDSHSQPPNVVKVGGLSIPFLHRKKPPVYQNTNPHYNTQPSVFQNQNGPHHPHLQPLQKITPPHEDPHFSEVRCGISFYNKDDIIAARGEGCRKMPFYPDNIITRQAVQYIPADPSKYKGKGPFYLYPIGKPHVGLTKNRHYGFDRIVLNQWCQAISVLTERPRLTEFLRKTGKYITRRPLQNYDQRNYHYVDCTLS